MHDDDLMDHLLRDAMAAELPRLSVDFDDRVMRRVRPRRLTPLGRLVLLLYVVFATAVAVWLIRELDARAVGIAVVTTVPIAAGTMAYGRRLVSALE